MARGIRAHQQEFKRRTGGAVPGVVHAEVCRRKRDALEIDYGVMPLEGLWWADDMTDFVTRNRDRWKWTLMIMQPDIITNEMVEQAISQVKQKEKSCEFAEAAIRVSCRGQCSTNPAYRVV